MFNKIEYSNDLETSYKLLIQQLKALCTKDLNTISNLSNASSLLNQFLKDINWVGFYLVENSQLILGPFQGLPACVTIPFNKGVCGHCATTLKTVLVDNVEEFEGHIACDSSTKSEIVIPIFIDNQLYGVLDIDSPIKNRFSKIDKIYLEDFVKELQKTIKKS